MLPNLVVSILSDVLLLDVAFERSDLQDDAIRSMNTKQGYDKSCLLDRLIPTSLSAIPALPLPASIHRCPALSICPAFTLQPKHSGGL